MNDSGDAFDERFDFRLEIPATGDDVVPDDLPEQSGQVSSRLRSRRSVDGWRVPEGLRVTRLPTLRRPTLVYAFEGWNDAGEGASTAARVLVSQRNHDRFAWIDPEEFFVFTETRPTVRPARKGQRRHITWPAIEFFVCPDPDQSEDARDLLVVVGSEPDMRWVRFADIVVDLARRVGIELVVALGSLNTDIPHTVPVHVSRSATNADRHELLRGQRFTRSNYRGPTGIVGVLASRLGDRGYPVLSLWGHAPHYVSASPNPQIAVRMLRELVKLTGLDVNLESLDASAARFTDQVREAVSRDPEAAEYVRELERQYRSSRRDEDVDDIGDEDVAPTDDNLPSGAAMVDAIERFLRFGQRPPGAPNTPGEE
jgi:proteasome assembly chaperone (PAC2) family protein